MSDLCGEKKLSNIPFTNSTAVVFVYKTKNNTYTNILILVLLVLQYKAMRKQYFPSVCRTM